MIRPLWDRGGLGGAVLVAVVGDGLTEAALEEVREVCGGLEAAVLCYYGYGGI